MRISVIAATALLALSGAGYYAYAQTREQPQQTERSPGALERLRNWVMDQGGTERAFDNQYWDNHEPGLYVEARTGEALFVSTDKYDSGSGWPSFTRPVDPNNIILREDYTMGMRRIEVRSRRGDAHLGHVFDDGPRGSGGQRFCINSCAIRFIPRAEMEAQGYGRYLALVDAEHVR
ncbi:MAG: peptide-methionine (R)-S-oxide reductase MsrB [Hyphomonadaceae bacterium]|jgi:methionine-R-sulfoxide reductase|nr:peptide-methionine (R)-S-oxide reductase MsrB [Hyphomonadaceae bacterium]